MAGTTSGIRVSDGDRREVVDRLVVAHGEGRLGLAEFEERSGAAYAAVVRGDLAALTADLPASSPPVAPTRPDAPRPRAGRGLRAAVAVWAAVSALNLAIWAVVSLAVAGPVHPWWVWVAGPWGVMLALGAIGDRVGGIGLPTPCAGAPMRPSALVAAGVAARRATRRA